MNWCTDDSWKYKQHSKFFAPHFDLMVTTYEEFLPKYAAQDTNALFCSWAVPIQWLKKPKRADECKYTVSFVGAAHGDRKEKVDKLRELGIEIKCFGYGWDNGVIDAEDIPKIFNDSIISLNFANSSGENQIKARVFEVTGSGGFLLTEDAKNLDSIFSANEIAICHDIEDCAQKIHYYLAHFEQRDLMVFNSFEVTSQNHTYVDRLKSIIEKIQIIEKKTTPNFNFDTIIQEHKKTFALSMLKKILVMIGQVIYGNEKGKRFARRVAYEFSWKFFKENTYKAKGIVGRMFYDE